MFRFEPGVIAVLVEHRLRRRNYPPRIQLAVPEPTWSRKHSLFTLMLSHLRQVNTARSLQGRERSLLARLLPSQRREPVGRPFQPLAFNLRQPLSLANL
jgi:hypothetical protein